MKNITFSFISKKTGFTLPMINFQFNLI